MQKTTRAQATRSAYKNVPDNRSPKTGGAKPARRALLFALPIFVASVVAYGIWPDDQAPSSTDSDSQNKTSALQLAIAPTPEFSADVEQSVPANRFQKITVKSGDSLSLVMQRAGLGPSHVHKLAYESEHGKQFQRIRPGKTFEFEFNPSGELQTLIYELSPLESFHAAYENETFATRHVERTPEVYSTVKSGEIKNSFYLDGLSAGLNDNQIMELASIFGWDIDFALEIRKGDRFSVIYEELYLDGEYLGAGNILAAEFINRGKDIQAVRYEDQNGNTAFYSPDGRSMRKAFLRTPLDVFRISSHFNLKRKHPVLNTIRAHKGTDYAAPRGTPIKAAGSGKVIFAGRQGGYGNVLKIQHGQTYKTVYAHLSKFARSVKKGSYVKQGQIVGYVGSTGLATGPHLHYEFHVNGSVRNPVTVKLPNGDPIPQQERDRFVAESSPLVSRLKSSTFAFSAKPPENGNDS